LGRNCFNRILRAASTDPSPLGGKIRFLLSFTSLMARIFQFDRLLHAKNLPESAKAEWDLKEIRIARTIWR
jgi:hypothetical protein